MDYKPSEPSGCSIEFTSALGSPKRDCIACYASNVGALVVKGVKVLRANSRIYAAVGGEKIAKVRPRKTPTLYALRATRPPSRHRLSASSSGLGCRVFLDLGLSFGTGSI